MLPSVPAMTDMLEIHSWPADLSGKIQEQELLDNLGGGTRNLIF